MLENGKEWNDYVTGIDYNEYRVNLVEYGLCRRYVHKGGGGRGNVRRSGKSFGPIPTFSWAGRTCRLKSKEEGVLEDRGRGLQHPE